MKQAGIGIVIPVYNRERELRRTFDSVVAQTYRPIHVVLVDNGSTDGSLALCRELKGAYETDDFRITVVEEAKRGPSAARNRGLACVTEEFVAFLDSDDEYIPEAVSLYMQAFESNPSQYRQSPSRRAEHRGAAMRFCGSTRRRSRCMPP